ncbi:transketolase family protein, partial [Candidatus Saccharibacteria bacterium]|nr:transketolase family protein [Candidatus Saccharibacteria bacterium]
IKRFGMQDRFGESGDPKELFKEFGLTGEQIAESVKTWCVDTPQYHR